MDIRSLVTLADVPPKVRMACFVSLGVLLGSGIYVARISRAGSYLSDDPATCINCHVMKPYYASWQHSSHARVATCNDCHVPHDTALNKYLFKAKDGMRHSTIFTLRKEPQVLRATEEAKHVIQGNCVRCHTELVSELNGINVHGGDRSCVDCHRETPHGRASSLSSAPNTLTPGLPRTGFDSFKNPESTEKSR